MIDSDQLAAVKLSNGESIDIDVPTANVLLTVLNALDDDNKQRMVEMLNKSTQEFLKVVDFCWKQVK